MYTYIFQTTYDDPKIAPHKCKITALYEKTSADFLNRAMHTAGLRGVTNVSVLNPEGQEILNISAEREEPKKKSFKRA